MRLALGASRARIFSQTLLEGLLLSILAVIVAMPLTAIGLGLSRASIPASVLRFIPGWAFIRVDVPLFLVTAALGTLAMLFFSFIPALAGDARARLRHAAAVGTHLTPGRQRQWLRSGLATTQVALALALLFGSRSPLRPRTRQSTARWDSTSRTCWSARSTCPIAPMRTPRSGAASIMA